MLGLACIGGEGPEPDFCRFLARGADIIAAADSGLILAENAGLIPDWIIGDMDSLGIDASEADASGSDQGRLEKYPSEKIRRFPHDKDFTDTELALELLWEKGCSEIWILGGGGGRTDHLLAIRSLFEREKTPSRWITAAEDIRCLDGSGDRELNLSLPASTLVSVLPLGIGPWEAESFGLKWPLKGLNWSRGFIAISNRTVEEQFTIRVIQGRLMIIVPIINYLSYGELTWQSS